MYVNIGGERVISTDEIVGIFDFDTASVKRDTREFLKAAEKNKLTENAFDESCEIPLSFIVCKKKGYKIFLSAVSAQTLLSRIEK